MDHAEKVRALTENIRKVSPEWTDERSEQLLEQAKHSGRISAPVIGDGGMIGVEIIGDTILIDGKDISGNLGNKTTFGDYSPIVENVHDSDVNIRHDNTTRSANGFGTFLLIPSAILAVLLIRKELRRRRRPDATRRRGG